MRRKNETRRGGNLGRAPECVCSAADTRKISLDQSKGQAFVLREVLSGAYIKSFDPDEHAPGMPYPTGLVDVTKHRREALHFATAGDALAFICQQSKSVPLRPDGKPNRPLSALTLLIEPVPSHSGRAS